MDAQPLGTLAKRGILSMYTYAHAYSPYRPCSIYFRMVFLKNTFVHAWKDLKRSRGKWGKSGKWGKRGSGRISSATGAAGAGAMGKRVSAQLIHVCSGLAPQVGRNGHPGADLRASLCSDLGRSGWAERASWGCGAVRRGKLLG